MPTWEEYKLAQKAGQVSVNKSIAAVVAGKIADAMRSGSSGDAEIVELPRSSRVDV
jgi:hypothetical protein